MGGCNDVAEGLSWSLSWGLRYPTDMNRPMHMPIARHDIGRDVPLAVELLVGRARFRLRGLALLPSLSTASRSPASASSSLVVVATCSYSYVSELLDIFNANGEWGVGGARTKSDTLEEVVRLWPK